MKYPPHNSFHNEKWWMQTNLKKFTTTTTIEGYENDCTHILQYCQIIRHNGSQLHKGEMHLSGELRDVKVVHLVVIAVEDEISIF